MSQEHQIFSDQKHRWALSHNPLQNRWVGISRAHSSHPLSFLVRDNLIRIRIMFQDHRFLDYWWFRYECITCSIEITANFAFLNRWVSSTAFTVTLLTQMKLAAPDHSGAPWLSIALALLSTFCNRHSKSSHLAGLGTVEHLVAANSGVQINRTGFIATILHTHSQLRAWGIVASILQILYFL
jgi:hypothetical protein